MDDHVKPVFDRELALEQVGGDPELLAEIFALYLEDGPKRLEVIRDGLTRRDAHAVETASHSLKGALTTLGATRSSEIARRLELMGRDGNLSHADEILADLEEELERLEIALHDATG